MKISLQLSSSLWSKQLDVWSHLIIVIYIIIIVDIILVINIIDVIFIYVCNII